MNNSKKFIHQMKPWFGDEERQAINKYLLEDPWITEFKKTKEFEEQISDFTGAKHCIVTNNGTISLTLAAIAAGIQSGDEVIVPNYTMIATPNSVKLIGAKPIFVDVELSTLCLNIELVKKAITPKTKAIILVTANGRYPKSGIEQFIELVNKYNLILIEDCAQSLGCLYPNSKHLGREGIIGSFSFSSPKIISTGQGGALITDDEKMANKIRYLKDFGRSKAGIDVHDNIGWNFKFTDLQAVIGIEQMKKLKYRVMRKKEIYEMYKSFLINNENIKFFDQDLTYTTPWFIDVIANNRDKLIKYLKEIGIGTRVMYPPINEQKPYNYFGTFPISSKIGKKGLWLPSFTQLTNKQILYICNSINEFYNY